MKLTAAEISDDFGIERISGPAFTAWLGSAWSPKGECPLLKSIRLPSSLGEIGESAFYHTGLRDFGNVTATNISDNAFLVTDMQERLSLNLTAPMSKMHLTSMSLGTYARSYIPNYQIGVNGTVAQVSGNPNFPFCYGADFSEPYVWYKYSEWEGLRFVFICTDGRIELQSRRSGSMIYWEWTVVR